MTAAERGTMKKMTNKQQRRVLRGWIKWVPVVAIPFAILFFHTWLNIQILRADYVLRELDGEAKDLAERLNNSGMEETIREDPNMLSEQAKQMAFVQPHPGQREMIYYNPSIPLVSPEDRNFAVAQLDGVTEPEPTVIPATPAPVPVSLEQPVVDGGVNDVDGTNPASAPTLPLDAAAPVENPQSVAVPLDLPVETSAPAPVVTNIQLDLPDTPVPEAVVDLESAMESLESL